MTRAEYQKEWVRRNLERVRQHRRAYYQRNKEEIKKNKKRTPYAIRKEQSRRWKAANPDKVKASMRKTRYGITQVQFDCMLARQRGKCAVCRALPAVYVDHDHLTGKVRGVLCKGCNWGIGNFLDCPRLLRRASLYLENYGR